MINTHITEKYGNSIYPTMVITGTEDKMKIQWLIRPDKNFCDLCRLYGAEFKKIATDNPREIENILLGDKRYYFLTAHIREGLVSYCIFVFLLSIPQEYEEIPDSMDFIPKLYFSCNVPLHAPMSRHSMNLAEYVRHTGRVSKIITDCTSLAFYKGHDNTEREYFYAVDQIGDRMIKECFGGEGALCRFKTVRMDCNMYIQIALPKFRFFLMNVMLMIAKFSLRTVEVSFKNEVETLRILLKCPFHNSFFGLENDRNEDVVFGEICSLKSSHPAFFDYEFLKRLADHIGASFTLGFGGKNYGLVEIVFSKTDAVFKNILHAASIPEAESNIPIYTIDIKELL